MSNSIAPGSSADVNVKVTALTTNPNVPAQYKTIILKKNLVNGVNTLTQEMMSAQNIKYVIKYDYVLSEDITIPANCILEFDGGSIDGNYVLFGNKCKILGKAKWGDSIIYTDIFDNDGPYINISRITNLTSFGEPTNTNVDALNNLNDIIKDIADNYGQVILSFQKGVTYDFGQSILLRDNMIIDGNGCNITFHKVLNSNNDNVTMYPYNSFITNRKYQSNGGTINDFIIQEKYASKNIKIRNINFLYNESVDYFFFNFDSDRGTIALCDCENVEVYNCTFVDTYKNVAMWMVGIKDLSIHDCIYNANEYYSDKEDGVGFLWTNTAKENQFMNNIHIFNNKITNYGDEALSLFSIKGNIVLNNNIIISRENISCTIGESNNCNIVFKYNTFELTSGVNINYFLIFEDTDDRVFNFSSIGNKYIENEIDTPIIGTANPYFWNIMNFIFENNYVEGKICISSRIRTQKAFIKNNYFEKCLWYQATPYLDDDCEIIIENNQVSKDTTENNYIYMANLSTIVKNNLFFGNITFASTGYTTSLIFDSNKVHGALTLVSDKLNSITNNIFINDNPINLTPSNRLSQKGNIVFDAYYNKLNTGIYTAIAANIRYVLHTIDELIIVDGVLSKVTNSGYEAIQQNN